MNNEQQLREEFYEKEIPKCTECSNPTYKGETIEFDGKDFCSNKCMRKNIEIDFSRLNFIKFVDDINEGKLDSEQVEDIIIKNHKNIVSSKIAKERQKMIEGLQEAIIGCAWCDLEDGRGKFINQKQLSDNILALIKNKEDSK